MLDVLEAAIGMEWTPTVVGIPLITPLEELKESPSGKEPTSKDVGEKVAMIW